jgi:hypothetical protein
MGYENVDHMATYAEANGGAFGMAASDWAEWVLRGDQTSSSFFAGLEPELRLVMPGRQLMLFGGSQCIVVRKYLAEGFLA